MTDGKILIVDDEEIVVDALEGLLVGEGYDVLVASEGKEALDKAYSEKPDVIVLDAQIPKMDGFKVCQTIKEDPKREINSIMVIIITGAFTDPKSHARALIQSKADDFILKPFKSEVLIHRVKVLLHKRNLIMNETNP